MAVISKYKITGLLVLLLLMTVTVHAQNETTMVPSMSPGNETLAPAVNMTISDMPTSAPTVLNVTNAPTIMPTDSPVMNTTAPTISRFPSVAPTSNATAMPSEVASAAPTVVRSASPTISSQPSLEVPVPTIAPTKRPTGVPSTSPSRATTIPPVATTPIDVAIENLQIIFTGVQSIPNDDLSSLQTIMEEWFEAYFNTGQNSTTQRYLHQQHHRNVQQSRVPAVRNMNTVVDVTGQDSSSTPGSNSVTYTQNLDYDAVAGARDTEDYAVLPFVDTAYKNELLTVLKSDLDSFADITAISTPSTVAPPPAIVEESDGLSLPIIIGIAAGGVVGLLLLACGAYALGSRRDTGYPVGDGGGGTHNMNNSHANSGAYNGIDEHDNMLPPSTFQMSIGDDDVISTIDDPTVAKLSNTMSGNDASALGGYGDQSVATVDYDYSKAYGGGGDTSVVSSVGGTLGDATRQTAGEVAAGRLALGASYDDNNRDSSSRLPREQVIVVEAPAGKLGVVIDTPDDGAPVVHAVKDTSVIANQIQVGDKLIKVDDEDVRSMTAIKVSKLISKKSGNPVRRLTIVRTSQQGGNP